MTLVFLLHALNIPRSIYRQYCQYISSRYGLNSAFRRISSSSSAVNKKEVQILFRLQSLFFPLMSLPNLKILFLSTTSARSQSVSLEIYFSIWLSNHFLSADMPSSCGIFGYRPTASTVHKIMLLDNFDKEQSLFKNSFVSLIYDFTACAKGCR